MQLLPGGKPRSTRPLSRWPVRDWQRGCPTAKCAEDVPEGEEPATVWWGGSGSGLADTQWAEIRSSFGPVMAGRDY